MTDLTNNDDVFNGTTGDDDVNGLGGDDTISGLAGDDVLNGGSGSDTLYGGNDDDELNGGSNDDVLDGGSGNDTFTGGSGSDTVVIHANAAGGIAVQSGLQLILTTGDGVDTISSGVEHIQFDNVTIDVDTSTGDALAHLGVDSQSINEEGSTVAANVLSNDIDIDDSITLTAIHSDNQSTNGTLGAALAGQYGSLTLNADGSYSYTAGAGTDSLAAGESANDVFTYTVNSGGVNTTQTLTITINGVNDAPSITSGIASPTYNDTFTGDTFANTTGTVTATDVDTSDDLAFGVAFGDTLGTTDNTQIGFDTSVTGSYGTLYINSATGAYEYVPNDAAIEALKTTAHDVFDFTVDDGNGGSDSQTFDVTLNGVNDKPHLAPLTNASYNDTAADDTFAKTNGTLVGSDAENDTLTYRLQGSGVDHSVNGFNRSMTGTYGTLYLNDSTGAYRYVPNDGAIEGLKTSDTDTFNFTVSDGSDQSTVRTLTITLNGANDTPDMSATSSAKLDEAGGVANGTAGNDMSSSTVSLSDRDTGDTPTFDSTALTNNGWSTSDAGVTYTHAGTYGTATLTVATGAVDYQLDDNDADTQGLDDGDEVTDNFTVYGTDGTAGASTNVSFAIEGANDSAVIAGTLSGEATEAGGVANGTAGSSASGTATDTDVDDDDADNTFLAVTNGTTISSHGTFSVDASGNWTYTVNENDASVEALNVGTDLGDSFLIFSEDGTSTTVNITIHGANDAAIVGGAASDSVTESGGSLSPGDPDGAGTLTDTDVDNDDNTFQAVVVATATDSGYGTYTVDASGNWAFHLKNGNSAVQALNDGDQLQDTFTVYTEDGTAQVVTITINGQNEVFQGTVNDDIIKGTHDGDTMTGLGGNDIYSVNNAADVVVEGSGGGQDLVKASVSYTLGQNVEDLTLTGHSAIDGTGNNRANNIVGNDARNTISGLNGDDTLKGGGGADTIDGGKGDDIMNGGSGSDTVSYATATAGVTVSLAATGFQLTGGGGTDKLTGFENVIGSSSNDNLTGNDLANVITGGAGQDTMTGGARADTFVFTSASDSTNANPDTITDLGNTDAIDLSAIGTFSVVGAFDNNPFELTLSYDSGSNTTTLSADINGDGTSDMTILLTGDHHTFNHFI